MSNRILNKGQLAVQETIIAVFVFVLILIVGMAFFVRYQEQGLRQDNQDYLKEKHSLLVTTLPNNPSFIYSSYEETKTYLDTTKLTAYSILNQDSSAYGYKNITVYQLYPKVSNTPCTAKQQTCGRWDLYLHKPAQNSPSIKAVTPVALYNPVTKQHSMGLLVIEAYNL
ncbi:MAG: hypothetical protein WC595_04765 [Candidatus Nanoarchaeia archaeon]